MALLMRNFIEIVLIDERKMFTGKKKSYNNKLPLFLVF